MSDLFLYNKKKQIFQSIVFLAVLLFLGINIVHADESNVHGLVFYDENKNGKLDTGEKGVQGIYIKLLDSYGKRIRDKDTNEAISTTTDSDGRFSFEKYNGQKISIQKLKDIEKLVFNGVEDKDDYLTIDIKDNSILEIAVQGNKNDIQSIRGENKYLDYEKIAPIITTLKTAIVGIFFTFFLGLLLVRISLLIKNKFIRTIFDVIMTLPLVLPPTVIGYILLKFFGINSPVGTLFLKFFNYKVVFSWESTVIAAVILSLPLMYRSTLGAIEQVDKNLVYAARTLGFTEGKIFRKILIPNAVSGVAAATILAFARGMGEYGATSMIAGNILGKTRTLPIAVAVSTAAGEDDNAKFYVIVILVMAFILISLMNIITYKISSRRK